MAQSTTGSRPECLSWLHIGDLHITAAGEQNHLDLQRIAALVKALPLENVDFVLLPGDIADDGTRDQFDLVRDALSDLPAPVRILPGDHDFKQTTLADFHGVLGAERLPNSVSIRGHRCLFLDVVSAGGGGPDFRLDDGQLDWVARQIDEAGQAGERVAVFMHTYPADLRQGAARLTALLAQPQVVCVDMGHTHYNELANDGGTVFMTTRSTGQTEEGPAGFSVAAIDGGVVSWGFQPVERGWPFVLITSPADHRLITDPGSACQCVTGAVRIRAKVLSDRPVAQVVARIDDGPGFRLALDGSGAALWGATRHDALEDGLHTLVVEAEDGAGRRSADTNRFLAGAAGRYRPPRRHADGSDRDAIGAWPEKHLLGTQLGPNRNGRQW